MYAQEKALKRALFLLPLRVLGVVLGAADTPEVGAHGAFAVGGVLLRLEGLLVGGHPDRSGQRQL